ncbi:MAG: enoyl-CoA hydratase/isomerase family protein [Chloroflexi bacterium]|nr:enoyl-CoA hydratase/isomerase family protein [Chloroflexota bacterium]
MDTSETKRGAQGTGAEYSSIRFDRDGPVGVITLNRPRSLNAMTDDLIEELLDALKRCEADEVRAVVITGTGRAFCAGDDLKGMGPRPSQLRRGYHWLQVTHQDWIKAVRDLRKPVLAAINGNCHGAGSDLALACDFRVAAETALLGDIRLSHAILIGSGATYFMPRLVGLGRALELLLTGKTISAREAERIGLVNRVVPDASLMSEVLAWAHELARGPTRAMGVTKIEIYRELDMTLAEALEDERHFLTNETVLDAAVAREAFLQKRKPEFKGN